MTDVLSFVAAFSFTLVVVVFLPIFVVSPLLERLLGEEHSAAKEFTLMAIAAGGLTALFLLGVLWFGPWLMEALK